MKDKTGYILIKLPTHPYANNLGYVREHRIVIESHLGRILLENEVIHHRNGIKDDNRLENLELFFSHNEHIKKRHKKSGIKTHFKKGMTPWNKNKKLSPEHKAKVIKYLTPFKEGHEYFPRREAI